MRLLFSALFIVLFSIGAQAQERNFHLGIMGSSQLSWVNTNQDNANGGANLFFGFGGVAEYNFAERYSFSSGFEYLNRGGSLTLRDTTANYRAGFIQIPLQIKMRTRQFGYYTYFAEMGFAVGFETGEEVSWEPTLNQASGGYISLFDATFRIGMGAEYDLGGDTRLFGRLQYHRALTDNLLDSEDARLNEQSNHRFDYVSLTVGILF